MRARSSGVARWRRYDVQMRRDFHRRRCRRLLRICTYIHQLWRRRLRFSLLIGQRRGLKVFCCNLVATRVSQLKLRVVSNEGVDSSILQPADLSLHPHLKPKPAQDPPPTGTVLLTFPPPFNLAMARC